jgi:hypothetical protein
MSRYSVRPKVRPKVRIILWITLLWNNFRSSFDKSMHALSHQLVNLAAHTHEWTNEGGGDCRVQTMKTQLWTDSRIPTLDQPDFPFEVATSFHNFLPFTLMFYKLQDFILTRKNHITWAIVQVSSWDAKHECHVRSLYWADGTWDPTLDSTCSVLHEINLTLLSHPPIPHFRLKFLTDQYFWFFNIPL